jgi:hypothetical protein
MPFGLSDGLALTAAYVTVESQAFSTLTDIAIHGFFYSSSAGGIIELLESQ